MPLLTVYGAIKNAAATNNQGLFNNNPANAAIREILSAGQLKRSWFNSSGISTLIIFLDEYPIFSQTVTVPLLLGDQSLGCQVMLLNQPVLIHVDQLTFLHNEFSTDNRVVHPHRLAIYHRCDRVVQCTRKI